MKRLGWCAALINKSGRIANTDFEKIERRTGFRSPASPGTKKARIEGYAIAGKKPLAKAHHAVILAPTKRSDASGIPF
ncbi:MULTISPECIES: hypothetical protein [Rhizobium/Agrobacterium group]|uniref:Uncharacterized protein n=1 Tax=Neorhizobium petrolearium TaxID=515361 RepID=A0ABY8M2V9_9HYPH|nr:MULTISPECIES: hypothetical protein [Rhizobium/Agrobacterium group]MCC2608629.1 hypothetical protein [Neorhizobium petrolearium]WGI68890.1 hypothetical protein QEO92_02005 [Neorhizobium petrolearium]